LLYKIRTIKVNAVVYLKVVDPINATINVFNYKQATHLLAQTTLRGILGHSDLDELLSKRTEINNRIKKILGN
jgi:regulator of protease activity HflC (stomatin/prohibitin superfamily)